MLVILFLIQSEWMKWVRAILALVVNFYLRLSNWYRWIKLFEIKWNWKYSPMTFLISFPNMLRKTMGLKDFRELQDSLFSLGMMIVVEYLKCNGHNSNSKQVLAILMIFLRHALSLMIHLRWLYESLSGLGADNLLYLVIDLVNSSFKKDGHLLDGLSGISSKISTSTWQF